MPVDNPVPLCTAADLQAGAFADLVRSFDPTALADICVEASRDCETTANRRFLPFTLTESHRAEGIDPDELAGIGGGLQDFATAQGMSYASALGQGGGQVRKMWLNECAPRYTEMWAYSAVTATITPTVGGTQTVPAMLGPMPDTGLVIFNLGTFCPPGSLIQITYSGGYATIPAGLRRAAKYMAASICCRELDPEASTGHDSAALEKLAEKALKPYGRT